MTILDIILGLFLFLYLISHFFSDIFSLNFLFELFSLTGVESLFKFVVVIKLIQRFAPLELFNQIFKQNTYFKMVKDGFKINCFQDYTQIALTDYLLV